MSANILNHFFTRTRKAVFCSSVTEEMCRGRSSEPTPTTILNHSGISPTQPSMRNATYNLKKQVEECAAWHKQQHAGLKLVFDADRLHRRVIGGGGGGEGGKKEEVRRRREMEWGVSK